MKRLQRWTIPFVFLTAGILLDVSFGNHGTSVNWAGVFVPFFAALALLVIFMLGVTHTDRWRESMSGRRTALVAFLLCAIMMFIGIQLLDAQRDLFLERNDVSVTFVNKGKTEQSQLGEVWLRVLKDGKQLSSESVFAESEHEGWFVQDDYIISTIEGEWLTLSWDRPVDVQFMLLRHPYSGSVKILWEDGLQEQTLYSEVSTDITLDNHWHTKQKPQTLPQVIVYCAMLAIGLVVFAFVRRNAKLCRPILFCLCWIASVAANHAAGRLTPEWIVVFLLALVGMYAWNEIATASRMQKYRNKSFRIALTAVTFYGVFALAGNDLFLREARMTITIELVSLFLLMLGALYPIVYLVVAVYEYMQRRAENLTPITNRRDVLKTRLVCFVLVAVVELVLTYGFYPANMSSDSVDQLMQAAGVYSINDAHPIITVLTLRALLNIKPSAYMFVAFQVLFFAHLVASFVALLRRKGESLKVLVLISIISAVLPSNYLTLSYLSKNPFFSLINLWVMLLLVQLLDDPGKYSANPLWYLSASVAFAMVYLIRRNTFVEFFAIAGFIIFFSLRRVKPVRLKNFAPLITIVCAGVIIWFVNGPIYDMFGVVRIPSSPPYAMMITPFSSAVSNDVELPEDKIADLEKILPIDELGKRYLPYNSDSFYYSTPYPVFTDYPLQRAIENYFFMLFNYPDITIKDRLDGCESLWNIFQSKGQGAYNLRAFIGMSALPALPEEMMPEKYRGIEPVSDYYFVPNPITRIALFGYSITSHIPLLDCFVWRSGVYIVLMLIICVVLVAQRRAIWIWTIIPTFASLCTLIIAIGFQIFAYQYFFPTAMIWFIITLLYVGKPNN